MVRRGEEGIAIVWTLCLLTLASIVGGALVVLSETETYASLNYRLMSQARYGAEAGIHKTANYILNTYPLPAVADLTSYTLSTSPVKYGGSEVVLSARTGVTSNYPVDAVKTAFASAAQGTLAAGNTTVKYAASARLMNMRAVDLYGAGNQAVVQTWEITADGTIDGPRPAAVQVSAVLERTVTTVQMFGLFATDPNCGALSFGGGMTTDSYDSEAMTMSGGVPVVQNWGGDVGTNGNLTIGGSGSIVRGSVFTPRTGVGNCKAGAVDALSINGGATVTNGYTTLPQAVQFTTPALPSPAPPTTAFSINKGTTCADLGLSAPTCTGTNGDPTSGGLTLNPAGGTMSIGNMSLTSGSKVTLMSGTYNMNTFSMGGGSQLALGTSASIVVNIMGTGANTPLDMSGGTVYNGTFTPRQVQFLYAGTGTVKVSGGSGTALMVYAPNASLQLVGGSEFYGQLIAKTIADTGGTHIHYDRHTDNQFGTVGNYMLSSFTWKKF
jgi:hypothetical protein